MIRAHLTDPEGTMTTDTVAWLIAHANDVAGELTVEARVQPPEFSVDVPRGPDRDEAVLARLHEELLAAGWELHTADDDLPQGRNRVRHLAVVPTLPA